MTVVHEPSTPASSELDTLTLRGPDALAFAQAQFACDLRPLTEGRWRWGALLTAQGRVLAVFPVWREDAHTLRLFVAFGRGEFLAQHLRRFVFRAKVGVEVDRVLTARFVYAMAAEAASRIRVEGAVATIDDARVLDLGAGVHLRLDDRADAPQRDAADAAIRLGVPLLPEAASGAHTAHALDLPAIGAASVAKGCYPGQEIVARTHFRGRSKRHLARFHGPLPCPEAGAPLRVGDRAVGEVVLAYADGDTVRGLAVVGEDLPEPPTESAVAPWIEITRLHASPPP